MIDVLAKVRAHLREHFAGVGIKADPDEASVTFLGAEKIDVLRFGPDLRPEFEMSFTMCHWGVRDIRCSIRPSW